MATTKVTFTFDQATIARLNNAAERLAKPKSEIVREAIHDYHERIGKLSESERLRMLRALDEYAKLPQTRSQSDMEAELKEIRRARRHGGRRHRYDSA
jgi:predicted DNA-binding protein